mmetsp:Transcript_4023/g.13256  ORF Transcript_4023/g.13256 Transcript_4023/m.13256 type:complete len:87 (-) Transcript_4023:583-843(-)
MYSHGCYIRWLLCARRKAEEVALVWRRVVLGFTLSVVRRPGVLRKRSISFIRRIDDREWANCRFFANARLLSAKLFIVDVVDGVFV